MRVAALYDIHGNLPALEAVLEDVARARADRVVIGGDVVPGPMPRETLARLLDLELPTQFVVGNGEVAVLAEMEGKESGVPARYRVVIAGSVGMPFGDPGAYLLLLGPEVEFHRTEYDLEVAASRIRRTHYPEAEEFAAHNVLLPPSEEKMLQAFGAT